MIYEHYTLEYMKSGFWRFELQVIRYPGMQIAKHLEYMKLGFGWFELQVIRYLGMQIPELIFIGCYCC